MTLQELRDWHAKRAGWEYHPNLSCIDSGPGTHPATGAFWTRGNEAVWCHPFQPTLDGADASFPNAWEWGRTPPRGDWCAVSLARGITEQTAYTGDKPRDLYELSKLAWEQEAAR